jgi:hypothetical protein
VLVDGEPSAEGVVATYRRFAERQLEAVAAGVNGDLDQTDCQEFSELHEYHLAHARSFAAQVVGLEAGVVVRAQPDDLEYAALLSVQHDTSLPARQKRRAASGGGPRDREARAG